MACMTDDSPPKAPQGLTARSRSLWRNVIEDFELNDAEQELLRAACQMLDRADEAADIVRRDGITTVDRFGAARTHPAVDVERASRVLFARLVAQLNIKLPDGQPSPSAGRSKPGPRAKPTRAVRHRPFFDHDLERGV